ncbi:carboxymuconolactone decarboxylase family protein [Agrococcus sp. ARC_14]|uniref:carboxymuconolactone decarboxylase family protein n=1 Tax=Agrococcus sp. ARC_14 TaxID=2919927 RepID=UPI001F06D8C5|nr:carboxymuconolactone decarboxylase family protein [Agrococcus sp. ARC_14]MCH1883489.1 carboxymuconolactone decarboxylase family protein [Agrococcus sp. ARC_14]
MARLPYISYDEATDEVRAIYDEFHEAGLDKFIHQAETLAHHPPLLRAVTDLLLAYYHHSVVPKRYLELAVLTVSSRNACEYCVVHHTPQAVDSGLTIEQVDAVSDGTWRELGTFDEIDRTVIAYSEQVTRDANRVDDELFAQLGAQFDHKQVLELTMRITTCTFFNKFNDVLRLDVEPIAASLFETATR